MTSSYAFESLVYRPLIVLQTVSVTRFLMFLAKLPECCFWFRLRSGVTEERHSQASRLLREPRRTEPPPGNPTRGGRGEGAGGAQAQSQAAWVCPKLEPPAGECVTAGRGGGRGWLLDVPGPWSSRLCSGAAASTRFPGC